MRNLTGLCCEVFYNFNVCAGDPDLRSGRSIPPPAEHVVAWFEVLGYDNVVLVEALLELVIVDRPLVPPGAAFRVGANTQVCLLLRLPELGFRWWVVGPINKFIDKMRMRTVVMSSFTPTLRQRSIWTIQPSWFQFYS